MKDELIVFVRIGIYMAAGRAVAGGWLPAELQTELVSPGVVEAATGLLMAVVAVVWYWASKARQALKAALTDSK